MNFECSIVHIILNDDAVVKLGIFYEHKNHKQNFSKILLIIICSYNVFFFFLTPSFCCAMKEERGK